jgi:hypothetical protein
MRISKHGLIMLMIFSTIFMSTPQSYHARRLEGGHINSQRLMHDLMFDRRHSRVALEDKVGGGDRLSPGGPNHVHNNQVHRWFSFSSYLIVSSLFFGFEVMFCNKSLTKTMCSIHEDMLLTCVSFFFDKNALEWCLIIYCYCFAICFFSFWILSKFFPYGQPHIISFIFEINQL